MAVDNWLPKPIDGKETGKMEAPLKAVDIRDTLNAFGGKVSNKTTSFFKPEANINRWSKHKPIVNSKLFLPFDDESWDNQTGTIPKVYMQSNLQHQDALAEVWAGCTEDEWFQYALPTGGISEPLRMGDFRGYRADATSPFKSFMSTATEIEPINGTATFYLNLRYYLNDELAEADGGMLSLSDIALALNDYEYFALIVAKFTPKNAIGGSTRYIAWIGDSTKEADWGELVTSINIGKINTTNEGTYEFAAALTDGHSYHIKLPLSHITMTAEIWYEKDYIEEPSGSAYYIEYIDDITKEFKTNGHIHVSVTIHAGNVTTDGPVFSKSLYAGSTSIDTIGPLMSNSINVEKGETGTLQLHWNAEDNPGTWASYNGILRDAIANGTNTIYVRVDGGDAVEIPVSGSVIQN